MIQIELDPLVYKLKDPRIQGFLHTKYPLSVFLRLLRYPDWLVMDGHTLKVLPEYQYKALFAFLDKKTLPQSQFRAVMQGKYDSKISPETLKELKTYREKYKNCASCQKKRYFAQVQRIVTEELPDLLLKTHTPKRYPYPEGAAIPPFLPMELPKQQKKPRAGCFDCVQKHIGQAYVTAHQALLGYPQHVMLCYGHFAQAIQECPEQATGLKALLTLCLGLSQESGQGFVPIDCLYNTLQVYREILYGSIISKKNQQDTQYPLIVNTEKPLPDTVPQQQLEKIQQAVQALDTVQNTFDVENKKQYSEQRIRWFGLMSSLSDYIIQQDKELANVIRNVRLMFGTSPQLIKGTEYDIVPGLRLLLSPRQ